MNRASQNEMIKRRKDMIDNFNSGKKPSDFIPVIAKKFDKSEATIKKDWNKRSSWIREMINLKDCDRLIWECLVDIQIYSEQLEKFVKTSKNENCKLGAIKQLMESRFKLINFYHSYNNNQLEERIKNLEDIAKKGVFIP